MSESFRHATVESLAGPWKGSIKIGPFGSQLKREDMVEHGHKVYGQENVIANDWSAGDRRVSSAKFNALRSCELHPGDVVLSMMGTVGKCAVFPPSAEPGLMDSHLLRIQPNPELMTREFLATVLQAENVVGRQVSSMSHGSIMAGLSSSIVRRFTVPLPPLNEQPTLSAILDTLDTTIRQTEAIVEKLKQVKQGLLHDLLTRGIDANGELRPPQIQAPHIYKDSPLGWIPREWDALRLGDVARLQGGFAVPSQAFGKGQLPLVRMSNLVNGCLDLANAVRIPDSMARSHSAFLLHPGDLLLGMSGSLDSTAVVAHSDVPAFLNQRVGRFVVLEPNRLRYRILDLLALSSFYQKQLWREAAGAAQLNISSSQVEDTLVPVQPVAEQDAILCVWAALEARVQHESGLAAASANLRRGLMDDLLTGRVRVTPLIA